VSQYPAVQLAICAMFFNEIGLMSYISVFFLISKSNFRFIGRA